MAAKPDVKWINKGQVRRTKNILNWQQDNIYQAHSIETPGFVPYISKDAYDRAILALKSGDMKVQQMTLTELGEN